MAVPLAGVATGGLAVAAAAVVGSAVGQAVGDSVQVLRQRAAHGLPACLHACMPACLHACMPACLHSTGAGHCCSLLRVWQDGPRQGESWKDASGREVNSTAVKMVLPLASNRRCAAGRAGRL